MKIIKLSAITSTNSYLKELLKKTEVDDGTIVTTEAQTSGRGQMGSGWYSEAGESLTFSILKQYDSGLHIPPVFINFAVSLAIFRSLKSLDVREVTIKWPNDILSCGKKICGILIENQWKGEKLASSVIGIGLNVNTEKLATYPQASSMKLTSQMEFDLDEVFERVVTELQTQLNSLNEISLDRLKAQYHENMFKFEKISVFEYPNQKRFNGIIMGVDDNGLLKIQLEDNTVESFDLKEIKMLY